MSNFDLEAVLKNSDAISEQFKDFEQKLVVAENYEASIMSIMGMMSNTIPFYKSAYGLKIMGNEYLFKDKSLNDFFQKSNSDINIKSFRDVSDVTNLNGEKIGIDVLRAVGSETRRDNYKIASKEHKYIVNSDSLLGLVSPSYPSRDQSNFSFCRLLNAVKTTLELNAKEVFKTELNLNPDTAQLSSRIFYDTMEVPSEVGNSDDYGWAYH